VDGVTHQELADIVGASRETVTKVLGQLQFLGCVRLRQRRIDVIDVNRLAAYVER
jgi:CRP/FNR family transcriptional regulator, cyclic AMP receptor protein